MTQIVPAGWATRNFSVAQLEEIFAGTQPPIVEIAKDMADRVSLKELAGALDRLRAVTGGRVSYAGTTDLVGCAGFRWPRYRAYLAVQFAQARFLGAAYFRLLLGGEGEDHVAGAELVDRLTAAAADLAPTSACFEIHGGIERDAQILGRIIDETPLLVVVDFANMRRAGLTTERLLELVPLDRIAYFQQRNLPGAWTEDQESLAEEARWTALMPDAAYVWEPKAIEEPARIMELFGEHRRSH